MLDLNKDQRDRPCPHCGTVAATSTSHNRRHSEYLCTKCGVFRLLVETETLIDDGADTSLGRFVYWHGNRFFVL